MLTVNSSSVHQVGCSPVCPSPVSVPPVWAAATPASPGNGPKPAGWSGPGSYQIAAFALGPSVLKTLCVPFRSKVSISSSPTGLLTVCPARSSKPDVQGTHLPSAGLQAEKSDVGLRTLPVQEPLQPNYSPVCGLPTWGVWDLSILWICPSWPSCGSFLMYLVLVASSLFHQWLFWRCDFGVLLKRGELKVFLLRHLGCFLISFL